eukprot:CAMPEP_0194280200 /NCGR_PEP_ID=MMETSP0169-20130528/16217_1 /TAXON_ID=218684 /ORGANISM="Corethron pennatum, Strain L29A3" /LENGTH=1194 /DNA_ID=CAMNT_0039024839 /DNA_START=55 /DNA_END=3639 /DNA_ORIENTATION=+
MKVLLLLAHSLVLTGAEDRVDRLVEWFRKRGGFMSPKLDIRRTDPSDLNSPMGIFATEKINKKEKILEFPRGEGGVVIEPIESKEYEDLSCETVHKIIQEIKIGKDSQFAPYLEYLAGEPLGTIPSAWSDGGRLLFTKMLQNYSPGGKPLPLPPAEPDDWFDYWSQECGEGGEPRADFDVVELVVTRSWDGIMMPIFDIMRHRNEPYYNTDLTDTQNESESIKVSTTQIIEAGTELFLSVNMCGECEVLLDSFGTPEILRDRGFVEQLPQRWFFEEYKLGFEVKENFEVSWIYDPPNDASTFLHDIMVSLEAAAEDISNTATHENIPDSELAMIKEYHRVLYQAVSLAKTKVIEDEETCSLFGEENTCIGPPKKYPDFTKDTEEIDLEDDEICDGESIMLFKGYKDIESKQSMYQLISTFHNQETNDTCFNLENTVQICTNYRPHYHEMVVHYTARHIPEIKRVVWVGGGDSMLLHDILKYPSLEKVVGLELDQDVTRNAFKHFGTQPHWDNPRVEWWYGDASKSLLMLPKDYFGSFDMVLVDLSETVMSLTVTDKLNIMQALALLLAPHGVMVKNELYFEDMSDIFVHTAMIHYYDTPVICSQALVLGSNSINFIGGELTDHGVDKDIMFVKPLERDSHTGIVHDYSHVSENIEKHCTTEENKKEEEPKEQTNSPGIMMIVEMEESPLAERPPEEIKAVVIGVLESEGLTVHDTVMTASDSDHPDTILVVITAEGTIMVHVWPTHAYCGFDVHLWSSIEGQAGVRDALVLAAGSKKTSSYRIVAGGMFGVGTWKDDQAKRGPRHTLPCDADGPPPLGVGGKDSSISFVSVVLDEALKSVKNSSLVVLCGPRNSPCESTTALDDDDDSTTIIWACSNIDYSSPGYANILKACEDEILETLREFTAGKEKIQAIVLDPKTTHSTGQVLFRILRDRIGADLFRDDVAAIALSPGWQQNFVYRVQKEILKHEPAFKGHVLFHGAEGNDVSLAIASKDEKFTVNLMAVSSAVESRTGLAAEIKNVSGGHLNYKEGFDTFHFFRPDDYDIVSPMEQWGSQTPLERQTLYQLESKDGSILNLSTAQISAALMQALSSSHSSEFPCGDAVVQIFPDMGDGAVFVALWRGGGTVVTFDGRRHLDLNLRTPETFVDVAEAFRKAFIRDLEVTVVLRDIQPRGVGRVVNFSRDIADIPEIPRWA